MTAIAATLITISAFMHATWNLLGKRREPSVPFFFVAMLAATTLLAPVLLLNRAALAEIEPTIWALILFSGFCQLIYFSGLANAYGRGDLSLVYPLARATPILLIAMLSILLRQGGSVGPVAVLGMVLVTTGCILLPLPNFRQLRWSHYHESGALLALVAALGTVGYTLLDDGNLRQLREDLSPLGVGQITVIYLALTSLSTVFFLGAYTLLVPSARKQAGDVWRLHWRYAALAGLIIVTTYGLVQASFSFVSNVSYAAAFRQLSIPLGVFLGLWVQKERFPPPKIAGIFVILLGLIFVTLG